MNLDVEKHILTFNYFSWNYDRLNQDLKNKWLKGYNENDQLKIQHFTDFLKAFHEEHKHLLNQTEKDLLQKDPEDYQADGSDFKSVLLIICKILKQLSKNYIIMIDELDMTYACGRTTKDGKKAIDADFSYLAEYENVHFILCLRPIAGITIGEDYDIIFPKEQKNQHYQFFKIRHRNSIQILKFLHFIQKNLPFFVNYPRLDLEETVDESTLPPLLDGFDNGVIWIHCRNDSQSEKNALDKVKSTLETVNKEVSVAIIHNGSKKMAESLKENNPSFDGPYDDYSFNGAEAKVILYVTDWFISVESFARAQQLLIILTFGQFERRDEFKILNKAVEEKLIKKIEIDDDGTSTLSDSDSEYDTVQHLNSPDISSPVENSPLPVVRRRKKKCSIM